MATELIAEIFSAKPQGSMDYVDRVARLSARGIVPMLLDLYRRPEVVLATKSYSEIATGLMAVSYSGGYQWRVLSSSNEVGLAEKLYLLDESFGFFARYLAPRKELRDLTLMWWDDAAAQVRYEDEASESSSIEEYVLRAKLLEIFVRGLALPNESAQLGCLNGLDALNEPRSAEILRYFMDTNLPASDAVTRQAAAFL